MFITFKYFPNTDSQNSRLQFFILTPSDVPWIARVIPVQPLANSSHIKQSLKTPISIPPEDKLHSDDVLCQSAV